MLERWVRTSVAAARLAGYSASRAAACHQTWLAPQAEPINRLMSAAAQLGAGSDPPEQVPITHPPAPPRPTEFHVAMIKFPSLKDCSV